MTTTRIDTRELSRRLKNHDVAKMFDKVNDILRDTLYNGIGAAASCIDPVYLADLNDDEQEETIDTALAALEEADENIDTVIGKLQSVQSFITTMRVDLGQLT